MIPIQIRCTTPIPAQTGIGLRAGHVQEVLATKPAVPWFEVHSENYFSLYSKHTNFLMQIRHDYPLSLHGVGLSLGTTDPLDNAHLKKLKNLIDQLEPGLVSEHLCWSSVQGRFLNDLLPLPYTEEALELLVAQIDQAQTILNRCLLIENISSYLQFSHSTLSEAEFMAYCVARTGCGILLDINNLYVNCRNHGWDAQQYLDTIPKAAVQEIHLAGYTEKHYAEGTILIDTHNQPVAAPVWDLYAQALQQLADVPTLIEWDTDLPPLSFLRDEAKKADQIREQCHAVTA